MEIPIWLNPVLPCLHMSVLIESPPPICVEILYRWPPGIFANRDHFFDILIIFSYFDSTSIDSL